MTAPISNHDDLIARRSMIISAAASLTMRACHRAGRTSDAGAPLESTDCASVCRVLRTSNVPKSRQQLESGRMSTVLNGKIIPEDDARRMVAYARVQGWLAPEATS